MTRLAGAPWPHVVLLYIASIVTLGGVVAGIVLARQTSARADDLARTQVAIHRAEVKNCTQIEYLKAGTRLQLTRSLKSLPTIQYYQDHPTELAKAKGQTLALLDVYQPLACK